MALAGQDIAELKNLINRGADINSVVQNHGETLLHLSVFGGQFEVVEWLLMNGASPNLGAVDGNTPLHDASSEDCSIEMVELLLSWGANPLAQDADGKTPYDEANSEEKKALLKKWMDFRISKQPIKLPEHETQKNE
eukprot:Phypoly_transcript_25827.p1 GENE.Phypoly_transcript_25827~~Phypoly_transcript_25827.p1  ORF type:complete len:144 (+),score=29.89 Phypoly_transcript_25827:22-432(+)